MSTRETSITDDNALDANGAETETSATIVEIATDGTETVAEVTTTAGDDPSNVEGHMTITETAPDGTETVAEITTTEGDDPSTIEEHITIVETAPDGTETVVEITTTEASDGSLNDDGTGSSQDDVYEASFDGDAIDDDGLDLEAGADGTVDDGGIETELDSPDMASNQPVGFDEEPGSVAAAPFDSSLGTADSDISGATSSDTSTDSSNETADAEAAATAAHAEAATEAQAAADEFVASGDYHAAAEAREVAENEAWEAGDHSMLSAYDSSDLSVAADKQEVAEHYEAQQAQYAQQGDYEAAREAADNAAYATYEADSGAGGADHTGQADAEKYNMDWAVHEEKQADYYADSAAAYAAEGDIDHAEMYAAEAVDHQASADHYGDLGEHGGDLGVYDSSSEVDMGGTYDTSAVAMDTGYDAGMDTSVGSSVDVGTDDV